MKITINRRKINITKHFIFYFSPSNIFDIATNLPQRLPFDFVAEGQELVAVEFILFAASLQLRLQLRLQRGEFVQNPDDLLLHRQRRNGNRIYLDHLQIQSTTSSISR